MDKHQNESLAASQNDKSIISDQARKIDHLTTETSLLTERLEKEKSTASLQDELQLQVDKYKVSLWLPIFLN